ncbi:nucleotide exchange factor GrpE [Buchnera aphidicola (Taiwanaphis decaspermi)]|uniref:nucleotide exchange factor GrpE n=1 Tax=Buchnera aphidicola TaxID=9 RepID=UPI0031B88A8F
MKNKNLNDINDNKKSEIKLEKIKKQIKKIKKNIKNIKLRHIAKKINMKNKSRKKIELIKKNNLNNFACDLLPIIENFERLLIFLKKNKNQNSEKNKGIILIFKCFIKIIKKYGIKIEDKTNILFDKKKHEIFYLKKLNAIRPNFVTKIIKVGYKINDIVIRKAKVIVSKK